MYTSDMAKLVDSAVTVRPFIPKLLPGLIKVGSSIGDLEARGVVARVIATLRQVGDVPTGDGSDLLPLKMTDEMHLSQSLVDLYKKSGANPLPSATSIEVIYVGRLAVNLVNAKNFDITE